MNRGLAWLNLAGVVALAILCVVQWRENRALHLEAIRTGQRQLEQAAAWEEQARVAAGQSNDLAGLRAHLGRLTGEMQVSGEKLARGERAQRQAEAELEQLRAAVTNWAAAVAVRDDRLKEATSQWRRAIEERNHTVNEFNALAGRYNQLVQDFEELQRRLAAAMTNAPKRADR